MSARFEKVANALARWLLPPRKLRFVCLTSIFLAFVLDHFAPLPLKWQSVVTFGIGIGLVLGIAVARIAKSAGDRLARTEPALPRNPVLPFLLPFVFMVLSVAAIKFLNGRLDFREPERHRVAVLTVSNQSFKSTAWCGVTTTGWNERIERTTLRLKVEDCPRVRVGSAIEIELGRGLLGMQWLKGYSVVE